MRCRTTAVLVLFALLLGGAMSAHAQTPGGLTALPDVKLGSNVLGNGGFETVSSPPAGWSGGSGWNVDQIVKKSGTYSWRRGTGAPTATQRMKLKKGTYKLSAWIKTENLGSSSAGVRLQLDLRPGVNFWYKTGIISGTRDWTLHELKNIVITEDREVVVKLENYANPSGTAWFDDVKLEEQQPEAINAFLLYPNYRGMLFDDRSQTMRIDVTVTPPGDDFAKYSVRATLADETSGTVVRSQTYAASAHFVAQLDGSVMQAGKGYLLRVALVDKANGATVYTYPAYRVSRVPGSARAAMNVAFDEKNRLLVRGKPRFLLGVYDAGMGYGTTDAFWEDKLWSPTGERRMDGMKINFYLNYWYGEATPESMKALMSNLQKRDVMYLQTGNCFNTGAAGNNFLINSSDGYVRDISGHSGAAGFYTVDECISSLAPGAFAQTKRLRGLAPSSVTFGALFGDPDIVFWRDVVDVLASDPYPMFGREPSGGYNHRQVADWTAETRKAVKNARPFMTVLQFFKFTSQGRWPNRQEMRSHAYMAIVEGARGLWWWSLGTNALKDVCAGWCEQKTTYMNNLKSVVNELAALEPALLADDRPGALTGNSNPSAIRTKVKVHDGKGYVFAYNGTNKTVSATFTWNSSPGTVTVNAENRTIAASGSRFTDSFGPYQAHVYVIGQGGAGGGSDSVPEPDPEPSPDPDPDPDSDPNPGSDPNPDPSPDPAPTPGAPTVSFTNPQAGASVKGTATVSLQASGGSGSGYTYTVAAGGTTIYTGTNPTFSWNTTTVPDGDRTLTATVKDSAAKTATATLTVKVANGGTTSPPPTGAIGVTFPGLADGQTVSGGSVQVAIRASGTSGSPNKFWISVNGTQRAYWVVSGSEIQWWWTLSGLPDGEHTLSVKVEDPTGKTGTGAVKVRKGAASATPTSPTSPTSPSPTSPTSPSPTTPAGTTPAPSGALSVTFPSLTPGQTVSGGSVQVTVRATGTSGTQNKFWISVDGVQRDYWVVSGSEIKWWWTLSSLGAGDHTVGVKVADATGKTGTGSITVRKP